MNHLNLLQLVQQSFSRGIMQQSEVDAWLLKGRYWFRNVWQDSQNPALHEGREVLRQILRPEEGYPKDFRQWLVSTNVVPPDLISD